MKELTAKQVEQLFSEGKKLNLIDVREKHEVALRKIPGVIHIPLASIPESLQKLEKGKEYIIVCRSGNRSGRAAKYLERMGFRTINMVDGMLAWEGEVERE